MSTINRYISIVKMYKTIIISKQSQKLIRLPRKVDKYLTF